MPSKRSSIARCCQPVEWQFLGFPILRQSSGDSVRFSIIRPSTQGVLAEIKLLKISGYTVQIPSTDFHMIIVCWLYVDFRCFPIRENKPNPACDNSWKSIFNWGVIIFLEFFNIVKFFRRDKTYTKMGKTWNSPGFSLQNKTFEICCIFHNLNRKIKILDIALNGFYFAIMLPLLSGYVQIEQAKSE